MTLQRSGSVAFLLLALTLAATGETIYSRSMDELSVAWFVALLCLSTWGIVALLRTLFGRSGSGHFRETFDSFSWMVFLALPFFLGTLGTAVWTLGWYFLGWE